mgnify:CR=1 FL=1
MTTNMALAMRTGIGIKRGRGKGQLQAHVQGRIAVRPGVGFMVRRLHMRTCTLV